MPGGVVSFLGTAVRGGEWVVPAHFRAVVVIGVARLDLRRAHFSSPITTVEAAVFAGHLQIGLPNGFRIEYGGDCFGGRFEYHTADGRGPACTDDQGRPAPVIRVIGTHVAGAIDVYENPPWDSVGDRFRRAAAFMRG